MGDVPVVSPLLEIPESLVSPAVGGFGRFWFRAVRLLQGFMGDIVSVGACFAALALSLLLESTQDQENSAPDLGHVEKIFMLCKR